MIHPGEKPFNCSKFKTISSLKRHERAASRANSVTGASQHEYFTDMFWYFCREIYEIPYKFEVFLYREIYEIQYKFKNFLESKNNTGTFKKISHKSHWYLFSGSMFIRYWRVGCFKDSLKRTHKGEKPFKCTKCVPEWALTCEERGIQLVIYIMDI